jgi:putative FmdB family regulatory protein
MPIYEYECQKCGAFEVTQRITDKNLTRCPTCKSKVKKLISNTSFQLKGTGWYITDYARRGQTNGEAKSDSEGKSPTTAESNGEAKKTEAKKSEKPSGKSDKSSSTTSPAST